MSGAERACAYPGCGRAISAESLAGVCRAHNHAIGFCRCAPCCRRRGEQPPERPSRQGVSPAAPVPAGLNERNERVARPVSLARAPWEVGEA